jgi:predicted nucleic acid-binding protein
VNLYVVDASVAGKWLLPGASEPLQQEAVNLLRQSVDGQVKLVVPDFFWIEVTNLLWKAIRTGRCTRPTAEMALSALRRHEIPTLPVLPLLDSALDKTLVYGRSVYDSIYLALALETGGKLVTADEKLVNAVGVRLPVLWLGAV